MTRRSLLILFLFAATTALAQFPGMPQLPTDPATDKVLAEIKDHSQVMDNLAYLSDMIGGRVTGGENSRKAHEWTVAKFREYGLENVHLETYKIAHSWKRGRASARLLQPVERPLTVASMGWSISTRGAVRGPVMLVEATRKEDLDKYKGKLKGAIVITRRPPPRAPLTPPPPRPFFVNSPLPPGGDMESIFRTFMQFRLELSDFLKAEGALAVLSMTDKDEGLLNMSSAGGEFLPGALPSAVTTREDYTLLYRLLERKATVEMELDLENALSPGAVDAYNTVAELRGSEKPDEVVILGAHLDSWDLGTGATDNGTGSMAVLEAARALKATGSAPKRTIRFVLFSGEEQGLVGSREYVKAHRAELDKVSGVLVHDTGTGRVKSIGLENYYASRETMDQILAPLASLRLEELSMVRQFGTDHFSFAIAGVPAFACVQDMADYRLTHHSQSDTFDKVVKDDLVQGAQVLAGWALRTANWKEMIPRK